MNDFAVGSLRGDSEYRMEEGAVLLNNTGIRTSELGPDKQKDSRYGLSLAVLNSKTCQLKYDPIEVSPTLLEKVVRYAGQ